MIIHRSLSSLTLSSASSLCLPSEQTTNNWRCHVNGRELYRSAWPAQTTQRKLFADKWDLVLGLSSINWWVLLVEGARYHGGFLLYASLAKWMTLQGAKAFGHAKVQSAVKQMAGDQWREWQWTADGEEISRREEECTVYTRHTASPQLHTHTQYKHLSLTSTFSLCLMFWVKFETKGLSRIYA